MEPQLPGARTDSQQLSEGPMRVMFLAGFIVSVGLACYAAPAVAESNNCNGDTPTVHEYDQQPTDTVQARHLEMIRAFTGTGKLAVDICNADVRVLTRPGAQNQLELTVNLDSGSHPARDYIRSFRVQPQDGTVKLQFPSGSHARVTITVPLEGGSDFQLNLGKGDLDFEAAGSAGSRQINVGLGSMKLLVGAKSYSSMQVNIGLGTLHDHRPNQQNGYFVVSREYQAGGDGSIEINVGMGSLDIRE